MCKKEETISSTGRSKNLSHRWFCTLQWPSFQGKDTCTSSCVEKKPVDLAYTVVALSISQLQLNKFSGAQIADREVYSEIKLLKEHVPQKEKKGEEKHVDVNSIMHANDIYILEDKGITYFTYTEFE